MAISQTVCAAEDAGKHRLYIRPRHDLACCELLNQSEVFRELLELLELRWVSGYAMGVEHEDALL